MLLLQFTHFGVLKIGGVAVTYVCAVEIIGSGSGIWNITAFLKRVRNRSIEESMSRSITMSRRWRSFPGIFDLGEHDRREDLLR